MSENGLLTPKALDALLPALLADFPEEAIERTSGSQTGKRYDTTGVGYQWVMDRLNEVVGLSHLHIEHEIVREEEGKTKAGGPWWDVTVRMSLSIGNWTNDHFSPIAQRTCYGGHSSMSHADGVKGAYTNALKKTAALFGAGSQVYRGILDEDNQRTVPPEERASRTRVQQHPKGEPAWRPPVDSTPARAEPVVDESPTVAAIISRGGKPAQALAIRVKGWLEERGIGWEEAHKLVGVDSFKAFAGTEEELYEAIEVAIAEAQEAVGQDGD